MAGRPDVRDVQVGDHRLTSSWVVFGDLQGFTSISEALAPAEVHATLQTAFGAVLPALLEAGAVIDKFLGDGFLALFPGDGPPPLIACRAALAALDGLNAARVTSGQAPLRMGMSIHGGPVLFCTLGHEARVEITAVSDTVNVASRLEAMTRNYGCQLLVSEAVADAVDAPTRATLRPLGRVPVRGRAGRIGVFEADGHTDDAHASAEVLERLVDRIERQDPEARAALAALRQRYPDDQTLTGLQLVLERR
jgi:class 3 adenylate cyclase